MASPEEIVIEKALVKYPGAAKKRIALSNVVHSYGYHQQYANGMNLAMDAKSYGWKPDVVAAMRFALRELGKL